MAGRGAVVPGWRAVVVVVGILSLTATACSDGGNEPDRTSAKAGASKHSTWKTAVKAETSKHRLDWRDAKGNAANRTIVSADWRVVSGRKNAQPVFHGPDGRFTHQTKNGFMTTTVEMQYPWAVVLDVHEEDERRDRITVYDLRDQSSRRLVADKDTPPPSRSGWLAMGDGSIAYTSGKPDGRSKFCVAQVELSSLRGEDVECAKPRHGFDELRLNEGTIAYDSFDDRKPVSCRTMRYGTGHGDMRTVPGARQCKGTEVVGFEDGAVFWIQLASEQEDYHGTAYVQTADGEVRDLGLAYTGLSTPCDGAVYFVRDNDSDTESDELMRWSAGDGLERVWSPDVTGHGDILAPPTCGGSQLTVGAVGGNRGKSQQLVTTDVS